MKSDWKRDLRNALAGQAYKSCSGKYNDVNIKPRVPFPENVEYVAVQLSGLDTLTGAEVIKKDTLRSGTLIQFNNLILDGKVQISYRAKLKDNPALERFMTDEYIELSNPERRPQICIVKKKIKGEFTKVTLKGNCWERLKGKVWLKYNGRYQAVPIRKNPPAEITVWLPTKGGVELILPSGLDQK